MRINRNVATGLLLLFTFSLAACESVALMPRRDVEDLSGRRTDRGTAPDGRTADAYRGGRDARGGEEIVGTIERVDEANREIRLRTTDGRVMIVKYDPATMVYNRDREARIDDLRDRDQVLVRLSTNARGEQYADVIRLNDAGTLGSRNY